MEGKGNLVGCCYGYAGFDPGCRHRGFAERIGLFSIKGGLVCGRTTRISSTPRARNQLHDRRSAREDLDPELGGGVSHAKPTGGLMRPGPRHGNPGLSSDCTGESDSVSKL